MTSFPEYSGGRVKCIAVKGEIASARFARRAQYRIFLFRECSVILESSAYIYSCQSLSEVEGTNGRGVTVVRRLESDSTMGTSTVSVSAREGCVRSLTYRIRKESLHMALPWIFDRLRGVTNQSVVLVVSPLVALMADQVAQ